MKILLTILQLLHAIHVDEKHGILFIENSPIKRYTHLEKLYLDIMVRSPRELLNLGNLNFPDKSPCYARMNPYNRKVIESTPCETFLDKFDQKILKIAKLEKVQTAEVKSVQKREVITAAVFGISIALTSLVGYFVGKAHTESDFDIRFARATCLNQRSRLLKERDRCVTQPDRGVTQRDVDDVTA